MQTVVTEELRKFYAPEFVFGAGALDLAGQYARKLGATRVLLVTDEGVRRAAWPGVAKRAIEAAGMSCSVYSGVSPNPRDHEVMAGAEAYRAAGCDAIVAVGGGSPMDCAKGIGLVVSSHRHVLEFEGVDRVETPMPPMLCIPTTAGTSADVSQFAILVHTAEKRDIAIVSKAVVPDLSLLDPRVLTSMDPHLTACTGMDALCHAVEAFVSTGASALTDLHALAAIRLIAENLAASVRLPLDLALRRRMMLGSLEAGLAFSNASLGLIHALAHSLSGFADVQHGLANALLMDHVMTFNFPCVPERYREIAAAMGLPVAGATGPAVRETLLAGIRDLRRSAGLEGTLGSHGVRAADIPQLAAHAMRDACIVTNPRVPCLRDIEVLYEQAL